MTAATSDKPYKAKAHRRERAAVRAALSNGLEAPGTKLFGDPWKGEKDGKQYAPHLPELMRK